MAPQGCVCIYIHIGGELIRTHIATIHITQGAAPFVIHTSSCSPTSLRSQSKMARIAKLVAALLSVQLLVAINRIGSAEASVSA